MTAIGVYEGNDPKTVETFETWFGGPPDFVRGNGGRASWADLVNSLEWLGKQFAGLNVPIYWTVSMFPKGYTLAEGATGAYDSHYVDAARKLLAASPDSDVIYVRVGEEFNGYWNPWAAEGKEQDFIATYRHFVDSFRSVSNKFRFEWNVNIGERMDPAKAYPGDAYVDIIGMDFYYYIKWNPADPVAAFDHMVNQRWGLQWLEDFAAAHHKPTAYSEWGIDSDAGDYLRLAAAWFEDHNVLYQSYWDSNNGYRGKLSDGQYASAAEVFKELFQHPSTVESAVSYTLAGNQRDLTLTGAAAIDATGNSLDNTLIGNDAANVLDGRIGADVMKGGLGDDIYVVDNVRDVVVELPSGGTDTIKSMLATYTLGANVENLIFIGSGDFSGSGNALSNTIIGGAGNDKLDGRAGADIMRGNAGNDTYIVDNAGDLCFEAAGQGTDTVIATTSYVLQPGQSIEILQLSGSTGAGAFDLTGNEVANTIRGNAGNNTITGLGGADTLYGNAGADTFVFRSTADSTDLARDTIVDFTQGQGDRIDLHFIDANTALAGDQAFRFLGTDAFTKHAGELRYQFDGPNTLVQGDVNGDGKPDFVVSLIGHIALHQTGSTGDFVL